MTNPNPPEFLLPSSGPTPADVADRDLWEEATEESLSSVQAAAEKWRTGLAAFVTIVTGGLLIEGPEAAKALSNQWRLAITLLGGGGLLLAVLGLWHALRAAAGVPARLRYEEIVARYGSFRQFRVAAAQSAAATLATARKLVGYSLALLGLSVIAWWWTPTKPTHLVEVTYGDSVVCGKLQSADNQRFIVKVAGASEVTTVLFEVVDNVYVVDEC